MADLKLFRRYAGGLFLLAALLFCVCTEVPEYCGDGNRPFDFKNQRCDGNGNVLPNTPPDSTITPPPPDSTITPPPPDSTITQPPPDSTITLPDSIDYSVRDSTADGQTYIVYGGQAYKTEKIFEQTWMAQNLNFDTKGGSWCYENSLDSCAKYGRLYNWSTAMKGSASSNENPSGVQGICPNGWHLPSRQEWDILGRAVGGVIPPDGFDNDYVDWDTAGQMLKAESGWNDYWDNEDGNGIDLYKFGALPGGFISKGHSGEAGNVGLWWTSTKYYFRRMTNYESVLSEDNDSIGEGADGHSVRCVADN